MASKETHIYHAAAGVGKTTQLMNIVEQHVKAGIPLYRIAFVTFTKAAATVAQERICNNLGVTMKEACNFRTIHSMCFRALNMHREQMMDDEKYEDFGIKAGYKFGNVSSGRSLDEVDWSNMRDAQLVSFEQLYRAHKKYAQYLLEEKVDGIDFVRYCREYVKYKNTFRYRDYTDLLEDYIREDKWEDVDVACIDEAQDCSPLQWQVLFKAFRNAQIIYVAGDDCQNIYSFSGSESSILTHLRGIPHTLEKSYRVPRTILNFSRKIRSEIEDVVALDLQTVKEGGTVGYITGLNDLPKFDTSKSYFFLSRNRKFLKLYEEWCKEHYVPYRMLGYPVFSDKEKQQFRDGQTQGWDKAKLQLAQEYYTAGSFYLTPKVDIETIHGVKGDEADVVVLMSDMSRLTWAGYEDNPNNEHKVFYVGVTRAKETLYIMEPQTSMYYQYLF